MMKKLMCLVLALVLCGAMAFAESDLDAANARIAELEAQVALYKPFYDAQIAAEFAGGVIFVEDVLDEYSEIEQMYQEYYGMNLSDYGYDTSVKQDIVKGLTEDAIRAQKAADYYTMPGCGNLYEKLIALYGDENVLCDLAMDEPALHKLADRIIEYDAGLLARAVKAGADGVAFGDDYGSTSK